MSDHNDIYSIVERLRVLEEGLDKNQRSVNQLSATFRPKTVAVLTAKTDPKNPLAGKLVGGSESVERDNAMLETEMVEDVLDTVKRSFTDYLKTLEDELKSDPDLKDKITTDSDIKIKDTTDRALKSKESTVNEEPAPEETTTVVPEVAVKSVTLSNGIMCEIHGNEHDGFEIRRGTQSLPTRFKNIAQAEMAMEMYQARMRKQNESQDYMEER
jgi:hypothetical protein